MHPLLVLIGFVGLTAMVSGQTKLDGRLALLYQSGHILAWDTPEFKTFAVYGMDAELVYRSDSHPFWASAADTDHVVARACRHDRELLGRVELWDGTGKLIRTIETGSYIPTHVVFAPDHTVWTVGFIEPYDPNVDFHVFRHYARSGEQLGEAVLWSQVEGSDNTYTALQPEEGFTRIFAAKDHLAFDMADAGGQKWIEVAYSGELLGQYSLGITGQDVLVPRAMTPDGAVYGIAYKGMSKVGFGLLDKKRGGWVKVSGLRGQLMGADDKNLFFAEYDGDGTIVRKVPLTSLSVDPAAPSTAQANAH